MAYHMFWGQRILWHMCELCIHAIELIDCKGSGLMRSVCIAIVEFGKLICITRPSAD